jgi:OOP family OmpA-OmpF porin
MSGCAGLEYAPKKNIMYYHKELPAADRAVEAARAAGKDKECPAEFQAAEKAKNDAYDIYWSCRTQEGIAKANEATAKANALCPKKAMAPPPPPPPPVVAPTAPAVSFSANPASIVEGNCSTLTWSSSNATGATIDQGIGQVDPNGSREVCPKATTPYTINATGAGGSKTAATTVTVTPKVIDRMTLRINFDTNKSAIRKADIPDLEKAVAFVKKYPEAKVSLEGYTDNRGSDKYNLALSERRAQAVKKYIVDKGENAARITAVGKGEANPVGDNNTEKGRFENRRVEVLILSE